jgi:hypothetical protein
MREEHSADFREDVNSNGDLIRRIHTAHGMKITKTFEIKPAFDRNSCRKQSPNGPEPEMSDGRAISLDKSFQPNSQPKLSLPRRFGWDRSLAHHSIMRWMMIDHGNSCSSSHVQPYDNAILEYNYIPKYID